jgi:hypothetical protein
MRTFPLALSLCLFLQQLVSAILWTFVKKILFHFLSFCKDASIAAPSNSSYFYDHLISFHLFFLSYLVLILYLFDVCRFFFCASMKHFFFLHLLCLLLVLVHRAHHKCSCIFHHGYYLQLFMSYILFFPSCISTPFSSFFLGFLEKLLIHVCKCSLVMILFHKCF